MYNGWFSLAVATREAVVEVSGPTDWLFPQLDSAVDFLFGCTFSKQGDDAGIVRLCPFVVSVIVRSQSIKTSANGAKAMDSTAGGAGRKQKNKTGVYYGVKLSKIGNLPI